MRGRSVALWIDVAVKAALLGLLLPAVAWPDLPQFEGKAMTGRALTYPIATVIVPVAWWLVAGAARSPIPTRSTPCSCSRS